jgi:putative ABC transport system permease protein
LDEFYLNDILTKQLHSTPESRTPEPFVHRCHGGSDFPAGFSGRLSERFPQSNTFTALLNQQVAQIGIMKPSAPAALANHQPVHDPDPGVQPDRSGNSNPLSNQASRLMLAYLSEQINFRVEAFRPVPISMLLQVIIALLVPQLAGSVPILQGRASRCEALSGTASHACGEQRLFIPPAYEDARLSRPVLISLRNTLRRRLRLVLTLITLDPGRRFSLRPSTCATLSKVMSNDWDVTSWRMSTLPLANPTIKNV